MLSRCIGTLSSVRTLDSIGRYSAGSFCRWFSDRLPSTEGDFDTQYRSPTEQVWPASRQQQKFAARVENALSTVLLQQSVYREALVQRLGFTVLEVRMSPDNMKAYVLWDAYPDQEKQAQVQLYRRAKSLRAALGRYLGARHVPRLEFRHDQRSGEQLQLDAAFEKLAREREQDAANTVG